MTDLTRSALARRGFLFGGATLGTGALLAACTGNDSGSSSQTNVTAVGGTDNAKEGKHVTIGFSAPAADHGWIGAISKNAAAQAKVYKDVTLEVVEPTNQIDAQIAAVETLINKKVDVIVLLPNDGKPLTSVAQKAMQAGIPVVNLDRIFDSPLAYRTWIGGDNYGRRRARRDHAGQPQRVLHGRRCGFRQRDAADQGGRRRGPGDRDLQPQHGLLGDEPGPPDRVGQGHGRPGGKRGSRVHHAGLGDRHQGQRRQVPAARLRVLTDDSASPVHPLSTALTVRQS